MLYEESLKVAVLDSLEDRRSSTADVIIALIEQGYNPNNKKNVVLQWSSILIDAYENIDLFDRAQQNKLDTLVNKVLTY